MIKIHILSKSKLKNCLLLLKWPVLVGSAQDFPCNRSFIGSNEIIKSDNCKCARTHQKMHRSKFDLQLFSIILMAAPVRSDQG